MITATDQYGRVRAFNSQKELNKCRRLHPEIALSNIQYGANVAPQRPAGIDSMTLIALTDLKEAWYGIEIDKKKYKIVLEDETEDSVYLKIVKKQPPKEKE